MQVQIGLVLGVAKIAMEELVDKTQLDFGRQKRRIDVQTYLSQMEAERLRMKASLPGIDFT